MVALKAAAALWMINLVQLYFDVALLLSHMAKGDEVELFIFNTSPNSFWLINSLYINCHDTVYDKSFPWKLDAQAYTYLKKVAYKQVTQYQD